mgnify:CR=1 FL=1
MALVKRRHIIRRARRLFLLDECTLFVKIGTRIERTLLPPHFYLKDIKSSITIRPDIIVH